MKTIILFLSLLITTTVYCQPNLLNLATESSPTSGMYLPMGASGRTVYKKITFGTLLSLESTPRYTADTTGFKLGCGLNTSFLYVAKTNTHYLTPTIFSTLGLTQNLYNADRLLDSGLYALSTKLALWDTGTTKYSVKQHYTGNTTVGTYSFAANANNASVGIGSSSFGSRTVSSYLDGFGLGGGTYLVDGFGMPIGGANQMNMFIARGASTTGTADTLEIGTTDPLTIPTDAVIGFEITIVGVQTAGGSGTIGNAFYQKWHGAIINDAGTTSLVGVPDSTTAKRSAGEITVVSVTANNTLDQLDIICTGGSGRTIEYTAFVRFIFMGFRNFDLGY